MNQPLTDEQHIPLWPHTPPGSRGDGTPAFLFHTVADPGADVENSLLYAAALRKAKVPFEMRLFERGRHGVGLATDDPVLSAGPKRCAAWLKSRGF
jgi:acetyl esterase/lipase